MKERLIILLVFAAGLAVVGAVAGYRISQRPDPEGRVVIEPVLVEAVAVEPQPFVITETFHGFIDARTQLAMAFQIAGRVEAIGEPSSPSGDTGKEGAATAGLATLEEGDRVEAGQVLARLEPQRYEASLRQATAQVEQSRAQVRSAEAEIARAEAVLLDAQREFERMQRLSDAQAANVRELEQAEVDLAQARAAAQSAQAGLATAEAAYQQAGAAVSSAEVNLRDAVLRAPMDAQVASVPVEVGAMVSPGEPIVRLVALDTVHLMLGVVESKVALLKVGQPVRVEVPALAAEARRLGRAIDESAVRQGVVRVLPPAADPQTGVFRVEVAIDNSDGVLLPGMVARAIVRLGEREAPAIPVEATVTEGQQVYAFFAEQVPGEGAGQPGWVARRKAIDVVLPRDGMYLLSQLPEGAALVVVAGQNELRDGQPIVLADGD